MDDILFLPPNHLTTSVGLSFPQCRPLQKSLMPFLDLAYHQHRKRSPGLMDFTTPLGPFNSSLLSVSLYTCSGAFLYTFTRTHITLSLFLVQVPFLPLLLLVRGLRTHIMDAHLTTYKIITQ